MHTEKISTPRSLIPPLLKDTRAIALLLVAILLIMGNIAISPALERLQILFADDPNAKLLTRFLVPAPSLTVILFAPITGWTADRFGRERQLFLGVALFAVFGASGLFLPDLTWILASRLALGITVAMILTAQTALIGDYFDAKDRQSFMGLQISARNFGGFVIISIAGFLAVIAARLPFAIYLSALIILPMIWQSAMKPGPARASENKAEDTITYGSWFVSLLALAGLQVLTTMFFFVMPTQTPFFVASLGLDSASYTGTILGALTLTGGVAALGYSWLKDRLAYSGTLALGYGLMAAGFGLLSANAGFELTLLGAISIGAGYALVMPNFVAFILHLSPPSYRGRAAGIMTTSLFLGQVLSPLASEPWIAAKGFPSLYMGLAILLGILTVGSFVIGKWLKS